MSSRLTTTTFLRFALLVDAAASGATGLLLATTAGWLSPWLGLPEVLLRGAGLVFLPYAAAVAWVGMQASVRPGVVGVIIALNTLWVVECALALGLGWVRPTGLGIAFVVAQAAAVALFAVLQGLALRAARTRTPAAA